ncbi:MAG: DAK2 domain-containing protein, partial [Dehalococcoidia bacterium]
QPIALTDDELTDAAQTPEEAALAALERTSAARALVTIFLGHDTEPERADTLAAQVNERFPNAEVEVRPGGQPFYDYLISVE